MTMHLAGREAWVAMEVAAHGDVSYDRGPLEELTGGTEHPRNSTLRVLWPGGRLTTVVIEQLRGIADRLLTRNVHAHARRIIEGSWSSTHAEHLYFLYESNGQRVRALPRQLYEETAHAWSEMHFAGRSPAESGVLIELLRGRPNEPLATAWEGFRHSLDLVVSPAPAELATLASDPVVVIQTDPAQARRARLLALDWPTSARVAARAGSTSRNQAQWAKDKRDSGQLLGVWDLSKRTFRHPEFQFEADGQLRHEVEELLAAMAGHPDWTSESDANGWRRTYWLYQPFRSLSKAALAFASAHPQGTRSALNDDPEGALAYLDQLRNAQEDPEMRRARTPAEVFVENPTAVIDHARKAALAAQPDTDAEGLPRGA